MIFEKLTILVHFASWFLYVKCAEFDVGNAIDLLKCYGGIHEMLPIGVEDPDKFLDGLFSFNVFNKSTIAPKKKIHQGEWSNGIWKMTMADRATNLLDAFFDNYEIEYVERKGKLFHSAWKYKDLEKFFGIPQSYFFNNYLFFLIREEKCINYITLKSLPENETMFGDAFQREVQNLNPEDYTSVVSFAAATGTHFTQSYSIGDVIYQVLVYPKGAIECFKLNKYNQVVSYRSTCVNSSIIYTGKIKTFSNTPEMEKELNENYHQNSTTAKYHNLLEFKMNKKHIPEDTCKTSNLAIIGFNLSGINHIVYDRNKSHVLEEMLVNQMGIRDVYI